MKNQLIKEKQNMTYLHWAKIRNSSGAAGYFSKSYSTVGDKKYIINYLIMIMLKELQDMNALMN